MLGRRFLVIVAVLMGLTALAATLSPPQPRVGSERRATGTATPAPAPGAPADRTLSETISAEASGQRVIADEGDLLALTVTSSSLDTVVIEGLDEIEVVDEDSEARFDLLAELPGEYPISLLESGRRIGTLVIRAGG